MNRMRIVARDTFMKQIKSGSFWFMILFPIIIMLASLAIGYFAGNSSSSDSNYIAVVTEPELEDYFTQDVGNTYKIVNEGDLDKLLETEEITSYVKVRDDNGVITADYLEGSSPVTQEMGIQTVLNKIQNEVNLKNAGLSEEQANNLSVTPVINYVTDEQVDGGDSELKADNKLVGTAIYFVFLFLMYMIAISFINIVLTETATEKGTKMIEFIFSSVKPSDYFAGKMLGNFAAVLFEILVYIIVGILGFYLAKYFGIFDGLPIDISITSELVYILIEMVFLFLLGIFISLIIAGMLGSFATKAEDAGKLGTPLIIFIVVLFYLAFSLMNRGDVTISKVLSYIPLASTFFMPLRLINGYATLTQGLISIVILIVSIFLMYKFGERVYKKNILNYSTEGFFNRKKK